jgi:hypothetical protein
MASWEPFPMEMGSMGEAKTWLWWLQIRGWRCPPRARVPPFIQSLGFPSPHLGPQWSRLISIVWTRNQVNFMSRTFPWNSLQLCNWRVFRLTPSLTRNVTIFEKKFWHRFLESPNLTPTRFPLVFLVIPTHQSLKQEHCALLQLLVG